MRRKQNFASWLLLFAFSPPLFFHFSWLIFYSLAGHLVGFILVGRGFRKAFRILGLGERKGRWAMEQDFYGDFQVNLTRFFSFFSSVLDWIVLILVWFERSLHSAQVSGQSCPWRLKLMTSQGVERTWIRTGSLWAVQEGRMGEVKILNLHMIPNTQPTISYSRFQISRRPIVDTLHSSGKSCKSYHKPNRTSSKSSESTIASLQTR